MIAKNITFSSFSTIIAITIIVIVIWSLIKHAAHHRGEGGACDLDIWWASSASGGYCPTQLTFYHILGYICFSSWCMLYTIHPQSIWENSRPFLSAVSNACLLLNKVNGHQHSDIFQLVTKERNSLEWMTRRGCLGVRTKVTPGLCLSLRSHIRHIRSARTLPLSRTVLSTICTFLSYTLRSSLCSELLSVNYHNNRCICNVGTDPAFTVGTSAHPSS